MARKKVTEKEIIKSDKLPAQAKYHIDMLTSSQKSLANEIQNKYVNKKTSDISVESWYKFLHRYQIINMEELMKFNLHP